MKTKRLLLLALVALLMTPLFSQEKGEIIYTKFDQDYVVYNSCADPDESHGANCDSIDINYDGIWDIRYYYWWTSAAGVVTEFDINFVDNMNACYVCDDDTLSYLGDLAYNAYGGGSYEHYLACPESNRTNHRLGFRKSVDGGYCYGWLRAEVVHFSSVSSYKLIDMAYCTIPDYPLLFGQTDFVDIEEYEHNQSRIKLFPNPLNDMLTLQLSEDVICAEVDIYGIDGKLLKTQNSDLDKIDFSTLSQGVYLIKIRLSDGYVYTEKVVVR